MGQTKNDRVWLTKKKDQYEKIWKSSGQRILQKIEDICGDTFPDIAKEKGILILLYKKTFKTRHGHLKEDHPLEISLYLSKTDNLNTTKELLIRMLVHSFIWQQYEYRFRSREQTLFEDILADEYVTSAATFMIMGRTLSRANCTKALERAVEETVYRISQKQTQNKLVDLLYNFFQEENPKPKTKTKVKKTLNILEHREELVIKLLTFLPENSEQNKQSPIHHNISTQQEHTNTQDLNDKHPTATNKYTLSQKKGVNKKHNQNRKSLKL